FKYPFVATSIGTLLKKIARHLKTFYIERNQRERISHVEDFLHLLNEDYGTSVNKTAIESSLELKRVKNNELPTKDDIKKLYNFTVHQRKKFYKDLKNKGFSVTSWKNLCEFT